MGRMGILRFVLVYGLVFGFLAAGQLESPSAAFLMFAIIPLYVSGPVAVDGFAGERERNTFETLASSPVKPRDLVRGKVLFSTALGCGLSWAVMILVTVWKLAWGSSMPGVLVIPLVLVTGTELAVLGALTGLHVSVRAKSVRSAMQWYGAVLLVIPLSLVAFFRFVVPGLSRDMLDLLGGLFDNGIISWGTALLLSLILITDAVLYGTLKGRAERLWSLNLKI
jgi:ABC-type Na+ efflux pump permease subunit